MTDTPLSPLTVGSLFAGIGGFDLGFERAGFEIRWQVEIDPFCQAALLRNWPYVDRWIDIRDFATNSDDRIPYADVICGGFPCQDISPAGGRQGINGEQSGLWREYARVVGELRPRYVVVENSADLLVRGMGRVLGDLATLGYDAEWECLPAFAFGAPHRRDRVFIVAYPERRGLQGRVFQRREPPTELAAARYRGRFGHEHGAAWDPEPDVALLDDGLPRYMVAAAVHGLGNSVLPQITEWIARRILEAEGLA